MARLFDAGEWSMHASYWLNAIISIRAYYLKLKQSLRITNGSNSAGDGFKLIKYTYEYIVQYIVYAYMIIEIYLAF